VARYIPFPARMMLTPVSPDKIDDFVGVELSPLGFKRTRPRRRVQTATPYIRNMFEFQAIKGGQYSARWGFSLDFVPCLSGGRLRWKRTVTTARFDLCIDPIDESGRVPEWCSFSRFLEACEGRMAPAAKMATRAAKLDYSRVKSTADVVGIFQQRAAMRFRRFSLKNYVQTDLAWGLALIAVGQAAEGERHLRLFCDQFSIDRQDKMIRHAISAAKEATVPQAV
jgi:hypothetical protein